MSPVTLPANAELIVQDYLRVHSDVTAIVGQRVGSEVNDTRPCLQVRQITGSEAVERWLDSALIQLDAYAETQGQARLLIDTTRAALRDLPGPRARGVVTGVIHERGPDWFPDPGRTNAQGKPLPRYSLDTRAYIHPNP